MIIMPQKEAALYHESKNRQRFVAGGCSAKRSVTGRGWHDVLFVLWLAAVKTTLTVFVRWQPTLRGII